MTTTFEQTLERLGRLTGSWVTEATHPALPGAVVRGRVEVSWLEGKRFLLHRAQLDHPDFPDSISIIGDMERGRSEETESHAHAAKLSMHYYDSRGVFRIYDASVDDSAWYLERDDPGFQQKFRGTFAPDGNSISGVWQLNQDDQGWKEDLKITYRRRP
jgi:hypothetical protein